MYPRAAPIDLRTRAAHNKGSKKVHRQRFVSSRRSCILCSVLQHEKEVEHVFNDTDQNSSQIWVIPQCIWSTRKQATFLVTQTFFRHLSVQMCRGQSAGNSFGEHQCGQGVNEFSRTNIASRKATSDQWFLLPARRRYEPRQ